MTAVFIDVVDYTTLTEGLDSEATQMLMNEYFRRASSVLEMHGGTVEKFAGDAVMAVFGIPLVHEDDAFRAVQAVSEIHRSLPSLNDRFEAEWGVSIQIRAGIATGEVAVAADAKGQAWATGDIVNVASRLESSARPGETLVSDDTFRLVRNAVEVAELPPQELKGKTETVTAWELRSIKPGASPWSRRLDSPMVGRERELGILKQEYDRSMESSSCRMVTVFGDAGIGKTRLVAEFLRNIDPETRVLSGSCLPYGDGITFWPLASIIRDAGGIVASDPLDAVRRKLEALLLERGPSDKVTDRILGVLGATEDVARTNETYLAIRVLLESLARSEPLVIVVEDIHWAEPTLLELLEYLVDFWGDAPMFLVCISRGELLERRPSWDAGRSNATLISLERLDGSDTERLMDNLLDQVPLAIDVRSRLEAAAEGNPLFVEEMLRMLVDEGFLERSEDRWVVKQDLSSVEVPPTIQALLAARLDRLTESERVVIQRSSVIGRVFWWSAANELADSDADVGGHLRSLVRKEFIRPARSDFEDEDAFQFGHILIRDAAYGALSKRMRADLHERFARWLQNKVADRLAEYEEVFGYHLEQAYKYRTQVGSANESTRRLGSEAGERLVSAGKRALGRSDMTAAATLLRRSAALPLDDEDRLWVLLELCSALTETGDLKEARDAIDQASALATQLGDDVMRSRAVIHRHLLETYTDEVGAWKDEAVAAADDAIRVFRDHNDELGLSLAHQLLADAYWVDAEYGAAKDMLDRALQHATASGDERYRARVLGLLPSALVWGPMHAEEGLSQCRVILEQAEGRHPVAEAKCLLSLGALSAMTGDFEEARDAIQRGQGMLKELGLALAHAGSAQVAGTIELLAGDPVAAEDRFRSGHEDLERLGDRGYLPVLAAFVAKALYAQDRFDEAEWFATQSRDFSGEDEASVSDWAPILGKITARSGDTERGLDLLRRALSVAAKRDDLKDHADVLMDMAQVLVLSERGQEAVALVEEAIALYERKGVEPSRRTAQEMLAALR